VTLSDATRSAIDRLVARFPERRSALLPALKLAQQDAGYLAPETIAETADLVGVPHPAALEVALFYTMLHTEPGPATRVVVCAQLPCALRGAEKLIRTLQTEPRINHQSVEVERTSECFGACHRAPMARDGDDYREGLEGEALERFIVELAAR
jgi:NADH-quinone oxidoreductase subunit E